MPGEAALRLPAPAGPAGAAHGRGGPAPPGARRPPPPGARWSRSSPRSWPGGDARLPLSAEGSPPPPPPAARPAAARPAEPHAPPGCSAGPPLVEAGPVPGAAERCRAAAGCSAPPPASISPPRPGGRPAAARPSGSEPAGGRLVGRGELAGLCLLLLKSVAVENSHVTPLGCLSG